MAKSAVIIDYGIGNVFSVANALANIGVSSVLTNDPEKIVNAERLILPGVGAFSNAIKTLRLFNIDAAILDFVGTGRPLLGICLGMQVLMEQSTEFGLHDGLGLVPGKVERIVTDSSDQKKIKVPHIGWARAKSAQMNESNKTYAPLFSKNNYYYFVHSFWCRNSDERHSLASVNYGGREITAAISKENILGVQFHPEKSGEAGLGFLKRFFSTHY